MSCDYQSIENGLKKKRCKENQRNEYDTFGFGQ